MFCFILYIWDLLALLIYIYKYEYGDDKQGEKNAEKAFMAAVGKLFLKRAICSVTIEIFRRTWGTHDSCESRNCCVRMPKHAPTRWIF